MADERAGQGAETAGCAGRAVTAGTLLTDVEPEPRELPRCWRHPELECCDACRIFLAADACMHETKKRPRRGKTKQQFLPFPKVAPP